MQSLIWLEMQCPLRLTLHIQRLPPVALTSPKQLRSFSAGIMAQPLLGELWQCLRPPLSHSRQRQEERNRWRRLREQVHLEYLQNLQY